METSTETKSLFATDKKWTFLLLLVATFLILYLKVVFIEYETAAFQFLADEPQGGLLKAIAALRFVAVPVIYTWKFLVIGFVIWVGSFMFGYRITFAQCFGVAIISEFVFLIPEIVKVLWFFIVETDPAYDTVRNFYPLSLMNLVDPYDTDPRYWYPLRALSVWEVLYWYFLAEGIHYFAKRKMSAAWIIVLCSYVLIFLLWLWFYIIVYK